MWKNSKVSISSLAMLLLCSCGTNPDIEKARSISCLATARVESRYTTAQERLVLQQQIYTDAYRTLAGVDTPPPVGVWCD